MLNLSVKDFKEVNEALDFLNKISFDMEKDSKWMNIHQFRVKYNAYFKDIYEHKLISNHLHLAIQTHYFHLYNLILNRCIEDKSTNTYILYNSSNNLYKIGKSKDIATRIKSIQNGLGCDLRLVYLNNTDIEKLLHKLYEDNKVHNEWFKLNNDDLNLIHDLYGGRKFSQSVRN